MCTPTHTHTHTHFCSWEISDGCFPYHVCRVSHTIIINEMKEPVSLPLVNVWMCVGTHACMCASILGVGGGGGGNLCLLKHSCILKLKLYASMSFLKTWSMKFKKGHYKVKDPTIIINI